MALTKISRGLLSTGVSDSSDATAITIDSSEQVTLSSNIHLLGSVDQRIQLSTSGSGSSPNTGDNNCHVRGNDDILILNCAGNGNIKFQENGTEKVNIGLTTYNASDRLVATNTSGNASITIVGATDGESSIFMADGTSGDASYRGYVQYQHTNDNMNFGTAGAERMRIISTGQIGVGLTAPASNGGANAGLIHLHGGSADWSILHCTTPTSGSGATDGVLLGMISDDVYIFSYETGTNIFFGIGNSVKIKIDSSGNLTPGTDAGFSGHSDLGSASLRYEDAFVRDGVTTGSDRNEKENITESNLGLAFIKELQPVSYTWKNNSSNRTHYGLIAQDIETWLSDNDKNNTDFAALIKEDISEEQDGSNYRYGLRYTEFISPLIKAIQELSAKVEELESKIDG